AVFVLPHGESAEQLRRDDKECEDNNRAYEKEPPVKIGALRIERRIMSRRSIHPFVKMMPKKQHGNEEQCHDGEERSDILQLTPDNDRPLGIGCVMNDRPEKAADTEGEEKREGK